MGAFLLVFLRSKIIFYGVLPVVIVNNGLLFEVEETVRVLVRNATRQRKATNATLSRQVSEWKWAVRLSERSPAAGESKQEYRDIPVPDVQSAHSARFSLCAYFA